MESKVFALDQTTIKKLLTIFKLIIPDFQRNFVWKKSKKEQLLSSLFRGFPIGAITLYKDKNGYYIIDGLQRINTLKQYLSCPCAVISFNQFFEKVKPDFQKFLEQEDLSGIAAALKKQIKEWYGKLNNLYEFEKVSVLYGVLKSGNVAVAEKFEDLELVEKLLEILKAKIEIQYDDIALIIYKGSKEDLPELFKNINTGSVALSQYEILQSVWNDYLLDKSLINETWEAFGRELDLIRNDYEIDAVKETGTFDIFKNIVGLNHMICCRSECDILFHFSGFKKIPEPKNFGGGMKKYFDNDSIAFEIYSTILCRVPNRIVNAIDSVYAHQDIKKISQFVDQLNQVILSAVDTAIRELKKRKTELFESKYHSLYVLAGIIFSEYDIDVDALTVRKTAVNSGIYNLCMDIEHHNKYKWFTGDNRQVNFLNIKIEELWGMRKDSAFAAVQENSMAKEAKTEILKIRIESQIISANTVKEFYRRIFAYLNENIDLSKNIPYATGKKRYLVNWTRHHINGDLFISPIKVENFYIETHKSRGGALRDIYNFMKNIGIDVGYVD